MSSTHQELLLSFEKILTVNACSQRENNASLNIFASSQSFPPSQIDYTDSESPNMPSPWSRRVAAAPLRWRDKLFFPSVALKATDVVRDGSGSWEYFDRANTLVETIENLKTSACCNIASGERESSHDEAHAISISRNTPTETRLPQES